MNYQESIGYLESLGQFGIRLGMDRIQQLLFVLGHPENQIKTVHAAGTNGKGSVTTMIATIFTEAGLRVGKFTSPHLVRYNERIQINEQGITDEDFSYCNNRNNTIHVFYNGNYYTFRDLLNNFSHAIGLEPRHLYKRIIKNIICGDFILKCSCICMTLSE